MPKTILFLILLVSGAIAAPSAALDVETSARIAASQREDRQEPSVNVQQNALVFPLFPIGQLEWSFIPDWMLAGLSETQKRDLQSCETEGFADEPISQCLLKPLPGYEIYFIRSHIISQTIFHYPETAHISLPFGLEWSDKYDDVRRKVPDVDVPSAVYPDENGRLFRYLYLGGLGQVPNSESEYRFAFEFDEEDNLFSVSFLENSGL